MPRIFDNIDLPLLPALREGLAGSSRADFSVGYFNLRGWAGLADLVERWPGGEGHCCRLLVGMHRSPQQELKEALRLLRQSGDSIDLPTAVRWKKQLAEEFREQLTFGAPSNEDEAGLRQLAAQLRARKLFVKLYTRHPLHAKLYLLFREDWATSTVGFIGSSNLTLAGLAHQGELNVDVVESDASAKLARWFEDRWNDRFCLDISAELAQILEESWARQTLPAPYLIYLKMAYHLSEEARAGLAEFRLPKVFGNRLLPFQTAAVKIAAHHLNRRGGVLLGDVVGLGKTLMATALAKIFEEDQGFETLILSPKNLVRMWELYRDRYDLHARVVSVSRAAQELPGLKRHRIVLIDESHNLRNREGKRYRAIQEYIERNDSKVILLSATPYNKTFLDLANQLRLFVADDEALGARPERLIADHGGETELIRRFQVRPDSLRAFEKSPYAEDWRDLMRLYLVRRTRSFIQKHYAKVDAESGRSYVPFEDGTRSYFPVRIPRTVHFPADPAETGEPYARLFADPVVEVIDALALPRYGLGNYVESTGRESPTAAEARILADLSRAGRRLMGFCRTNLFKRLESSGFSFLQSIERHVLRNFIVLHALEQGLPVPIGPQDGAMLDPRIYDGDAEEARAGEVLAEGDVPPTPADEPGDPLPSDGWIEEDFRRRAAELYGRYATIEKKRFGWLRPALFVPALAPALLDDSRNLLAILVVAGPWEPARDRKLAALCDLVSRDHAGEKVLVFSQFADTVLYLERELAARGVRQVGAATGASPDPTLLAWRFSPKSNDRKIAPQEELRVLLATDVLSEGQNLQDGRVVVNYDIPWAIIRLIQRVGRIDRIGQNAESLFCYSFLPAQGVEHIIRLRRRIRQRLRENAEVVGTDEAFFDDDYNDQTLLDLYHEKAGLLDGEPDVEVDLASYAYEIWKNALAADPTLERQVTALPPVVYSARAVRPRPAEDAAAEEPSGVLVYARDARGHDALVRLDREGRIVTQSHLAVLQAAAAPPREPAAPRDPDHHQLVRRGVRQIADRRQNAAGALGRPSGARSRAYERLKDYLHRVYKTELDRIELHRAIDQIYRFPLRAGAADTLNRQLKSGIPDDDFIRLILVLWEEDRLCAVVDAVDAVDDPEPRILCSLGLVGGD